MHRRRLTMSAIGACLVVAGLVAYLATGTGHNASADIRHAPIVPSTGAVPAPGPLAGSSGSPISPTGTASTVARPSPAASSPTPSKRAPLAGRIQPKVAYQGVATAYAAGDGTGACLFDPTSDPMIAAMNVADYESAKACGASILIRAGDGKSITVRIVNECPAPCAPGQIDLSQQAFAKLADLKVGRLPITWSLLSPGTADTISIRYKTGSSRWWCGIQVIGHRNPVALVEVRAGGGWRQLPRTDYNYFLSADGGGCGGEIRVTDIYGQQLVIDGIALSPNVAQRTTVQFAQH